MRVCRFHTGLMFALAALLTACGDTGYAPHEDSAADLQPQFHAESDPRKLSEWGLFDLSGGSLQLAERVVSYDLNSPLFTDYAHKLRTIWMPESADPGYFSADTIPQMPVGTVISKTFYYPLANAGDRDEESGRTDSIQKAVLKTPDPMGQFNPALGQLSDILLMETRLLVRRASGWAAISYVWDTDQQDATLTRIGAVDKLTLVDGEEGSATVFAYVVPNRNQCAGCHAPNATTKTLVPLGVRKRHMDKTYERSNGAENQIATLQQAGYLISNQLGEHNTHKANANWLDTGETLDLRARSYLDINCSHCHNPVGPADTSGLDLTVDAPLGEAYGICKLPIAAGPGTGGRSHGIVPGKPDQSILLYRMETTNPAAMMPELGRSLAHREGAALIREWIAGLKGDCSTS